MLKNFLLYVLTIPVFFAFDMLWLGVIAKDFYRRNFGHLMRPDTKWAAAIIFYLIFIVGLLMFAVLPALEKGTMLRAIFLGASFGFFCYATFDLTGYAVIRDFPLSIVLADILWGIVLSGAVAGASYFLGEKFVY
jgi:uncharacterized membrane protein